VSFKGEGRYHAVDDFNGIEPSGLVLSVGLKAYFALQFSSSALAFLLFGAVASGAHLTCGAAVPSGYHPVLGEKSL